jgi:hypothetical protein
MITRTCAAIAAIALIVAATSSAFACGGAHARASTMTKVSYNAPVKQAR